MPAEWKTNNHTAAVYTDADGVEHPGYLKEDCYDEYANYLAHFVTYLRNNGVELDAISIQNEPDMKATYAGCLWTPDQMARFLKYYAQVIPCPLIAPESVGLTDNYVQAFLNDSVLAHLAIYAGHQYGYLQNGFTSIQKKGKEAWMTEYLINWNADENTTRSFNWSVDAFTFATKINEAMLANLNAWIHYASKRYYGMLGDGTYGTSDGVITKRGYILSHFARYAIGTTRIKSTFSDATGQLTGSSYLSSTGDSVILMVINPSTDSYLLTVDLPFNTLSGKTITTTESKNMAVSAINLDQETVRPKVTVPASSVMTLLFKKSSERPVSTLIGEPIHDHKIENQTTTSPAFGTTYRLSGQTCTFDHSHNLISSYTTTNNGYLKLNKPYHKLVFRVERITSTMNYTSANTTLYYINNQGAVNSHNYGTVRFSQSAPTDWVLDISRLTLPDGCTGLLSISNSNYSSILNLQLGDVYFLLENEKLHRFTGHYCPSDSYLLDCLEDTASNWLDFSATDSLPAGENWQGKAANTNCLFYTSGDNNRLSNNVIADTTCEYLRLSDTGNGCYAPINFKAVSASYTTTLIEYKLLTLPFEATLPEGMTAYLLQPSATEVRGIRLPRAPFPPIPLFYQGYRHFYLDRQWHRSYCSW
jgi:glucuronoarabinoxylan endo-1,4-beta-xylanase